MEKFRVGTVAGHVLRDLFPVSGRARENVENRQWQPLCKFAAVLFPVGDEVKAISSDGEFANRVSRDGSCVCVCVYVCVREQR